ncbi:pilus assembly protein [Pseudomonas sp. v388]|uniref:pilus assembly protein n=1 Tax=Pseudomonas sp. v388 TaxID=2479849 RepID=UPI000F782CB0|nr:PilC/PilY family type IV pilus protein [Pseudomonas sp. v388]RRV06155.1 pilus assembly protein [Pseudomonas sp. v388]
MPVAETIRRCLKYIYGAGLMLYLAAPAYAFTPAQVPLLSSSAVTPNVMLQVDNSGSMDTIIFDAGFDASLPRTAVYKSRYVCILVLCSYVQGEEISTAENSYVTLSSLNTDGCGSNYSFFRNGAVICLRLPDPAEGRTTRYPGRYLSYLVAQAAANKTVTVSSESRMTAAVSVARKLVEANSSLRIGLATYNPVNRDNGPGGNILRDVLDLSYVAPSVYQPDGVNAKTAKENYDALLKAIDNLRAVANTPLAETYYQVTRYFRGLSPFPAYGGSPSIYTSPIQYRCQKNYGVVLTDGLPTYDRTFATDDPDDPLDSSRRRRLPNWDGISNDGPLRDESNEGDSLYLDDIAQFAYDIDMMKGPSTNQRKELTGKNWDTAGFPKQNLTTYTIGFTLDNQMLLDAADNTHGRGKYFQANDSAGLTSALNLALSDIYAKAGSGGGGAASSSTLATGTRYYQALYDPTDWHGTINAFNLNPTTGESDSLAWTTDTTITTNTTAPTFETWAASRAVLEFSNLTAAQQVDITATLPTGVTGPELIAWAKGTANAKLRARTRLLGDLINTNLTVAVPSAKTSTDFGTGPSYTDYLTRKAASMPLRLLVNANDGFFNVINGDGRRTYAYMPSTALTSLATIASTTYGSGVHKFTVDGPISVFDTQQAGGAWRTVAVGGLGAGGKAFFGIKLFEGISSTVSALWEVKAPGTNTPADKFNNLGYTYSKPEAARMVNGTGIVVVGNGYGSFTGRASLFVLNASTGELIAEIPTPATETDNGLSSVRLLVNAQNVVQAAYAGDLKGRLWKFDLSGAAATSWKVAYDGAPLFTAPGKASQPITVQPFVLDHPVNGKIIYFGTGKFLEATDKQTNGQQAFYAVWDANGASGDLGQGSLQVQNSVETVNDSGGSYFKSTGNNVDWTTKRGWYIPLFTSAPYIGERIIFPAQTSRGRILFTTAAVNSSDPCESTGTGRLFELDAATGNMLTYAVLDTNGDGLVNASDKLIAGVSIGTGIPVITAVLEPAGAGTSDSSPADDYKYLQDSSGNWQRLPEEGGAASVFQRIMWRQIQ